MKPAPGKKLMLQIFYKTEKNLFVMNNSNKPGTTRIVPYLLVYVSKDALY